MQILASRNTTSKPETISSLVSQYRWFEVKQSKVNESVTPPYEIMLRQQQACTEIATYHHLTVPQQTILL